MRDMIILYGPKVDFSPYYPHFWAPLSLISIAAPLISLGFKVVVCDGNLDEGISAKEVLDKCSEEVLFVGISSMIGGCQLERGIEFAEYVKAKKSKIPVIFGGGMATVEPRFLLQQSCIDFVVSGQGEIPLAEIAQKLASGSEIFGIAGVGSKHDESDPDTAFYDRSNFSPYPWHSINIEQYLRRDHFLGNRTLNYISSQGCPQKCGYCSEAFACKSRWTAFTAERTFRETSDLVGLHNLTGIKFYDSNFFVNRKRVLEFCHLMKSATNHFLWSASAHPKGLTMLRNYQKDLRGSGLRRLLIGAESGDQKILDFIKKGCKKEETLQAATICAQSGIGATFTFIVGFPEVEENFDATFNLIRDLKKINCEFEIKIHFYSPFPGTTLYGLSEKAGFQKPQTVLEWSRNDYYQAQTPWISSDVIERVKEFRKTLL